MAQNHVGLIEHYARLVGERCLALGPVERVTVSITKPGALAAGLALIEAVDVAAPGPGVAASWDCSSAARIQRR